MPTAWFRAKGPGAVFTKSIPARTSGERQPLRTIMKTLAWIAFSLFVLKPCRAAVPVVDVDSPFGGTKEAYSSFGQTFTPTITGTLGTLRLLVASSAPSFAVTVWDFDAGTRRLGSILGSQSVTSSIAFSSYGWAEVSFATGILQTAGTPMAFTIEGNAGFWGPAISSLGRDVYSGGDFFEYSGNPPVIPITRDLVFQTLVTPVPETSAPILLASASVLLLSSRRRPRSMRIQVEIPAFATSGMWVGSTHGQSCGIQETNGSIAGRAESLIGEFPAPLAARAGLRRF